MSSESFLRGNKGEWSEVYAFLRLLAKGELFAADANLKRIDKIVYPILNIIREDTKGEVCKYNTSDKDGNIQIYLNNKSVLALPVGEFKNQADTLLLQIREGNGVFCARQSTADFLKKIFIHKLKAPSRDKADITLQLYDINTGFVPQIGFSIKSQLGSPSTLLNAGRTTNFIYSVKGLKTEDIPEINAIDEQQKIRVRLNIITDKGGELTFCGMENDIFKNNLIMIDSLMPCLISQMLLAFYNRSTGRNDSGNCMAITKSIMRSDPFQLSNGMFYQYKIKELLSAIALGMKPGTPWDGLDEATGGYIIVKVNGEVLTYHLYNRNAFKTYLLDNTKFDTASSQRHEFGKLYKKNNEIFIKLNLQIRFI